MTRGEATALCCRWHAAALHCSRQQAAETPCIVASVCATSLPKLCFLLSQVKFAKASQPPPHALPASSRCEALLFCDAAADANSTIVSAGTCLLSFDPSTDKDAYTAAWGDAVPWTSGVLRSPDGGSPSPAPTPPASPSPAPVPSPSPASSPEPSTDGTPPGPNGECPDGLEMCGSMCVDVKSSMSNCGFCGNRQGAAELLGGAAAGRSICRVAPCSASHECAAPLFIPVPRSSHK